MFNLFIILYGEDPYDHDRRCNEYHREYIDEENLPEHLKYHQDQVEKLIQAKRMVWAVGLVISFNDTESKCVEAFRFNTPLRHRIVLNPEAKRDAKVVAKKKIIANEWLMNFEPAEAVHNEEAQDVEGFL
jgi:hypothetical protein